MAKKKDDFTFAEILNVEEDFLKIFLERYLPDIKRFFPDFNNEELKNKKVLFILRNLVPVGLFVYEGEQNQVVDIKVDYVIPDYRDLKNAQYFFTGGKDYFLNRGFEKFRAVSKVEEHNKYLEKIGFVEKEENIYEMKISREN